MENGRVVAEVVRAWVAIALPGEYGAASRAGRIAESAYLDGASIQEACHSAMGFVQSWINHPSHWKATNDAMALAS